MRWQDVGAEGRVRYFDELLADRRTNGRAARDSDADALIHGADSLDGSNSRGLI